MEALDKMVNFKVGEVITKELRYTQSYTQIYDALTANDEKQLQYQVYRSAKLIKKICSNRNCKIGKEPKNLAIKIENTELVEVKKFTYLDSTLTEDVKCIENFNHRRNLT